MASWTIHTPPVPAGGIPEPERFVSVKDGVRPFAVLFGPLWLLAKKLWLGALIALLLEGALLVLIWRLGLPDGTRAALQGAYHLLLGLEASSIQRWTLARRGWREVGVIDADNRTEADIRAVVLLSDAESAAPPAPPPSSAVAFASVPPAPKPGFSERPVLGLFPEARPR